MNWGGLTEREIGLIVGVLRRRPEVTGAILFGSRAKGTAKPASDIDLALEGIDGPMQAEAVSAELDELPLPYRFDVQALSAIQSTSVREHIQRVGVRVYEKAAQDRTQQEKGAPVQGAGA